MKANSLFLLRKVQIQKLSFAQEWNEDEEEKDEDNSDDDNHKEEKIEITDTNEKEESKNIEKTNESSSSNENELEDEKPKVLKKRFGKNPNVDTSFIPDKEREAEEDSLRY